MKIGSYESHPAADIFPLVEGADFEALVDDIRANGLREPILRIWVDSGYGNGTRTPLILDGRNRLRACEAARVPPDFRDYEGSDPVGFVLSLNLHRRHLNETQRANVAARVANLPPGRPSDEKGPIGTVSIADAASMLNVGDRTVKRAKAVLKAAAPEVVALMDRGDLSLDAATKIVSRPAEEQAAIVQRLDEQKAEKGIVSAAAVIRQHDRDKATERIVNEPAPLPTGPFRVIVADPPWAYDSREDDGSHRGALTYPSMTTDEVCALPIGEMAHDDCVLWLWTTNAFMRDAYRVLDAWGFREKTILTWKKSQIGLGDWLRNATEHCILAVRGNPTVRGESQPTWFEAPRREHSRKPDEFFEIVERTCPAPLGGRFELFSREPRPGWARWGAEADKFEAA